MTDISEGKSIFSRLGATGSLNFQYRVPLHTPLWVRMYSIQYCRARAWLYWVK